MTTIDVVPSATASYRLNEGLFHLFLWFGEPIDGCSALDGFAFPSIFAYIGDSWWPMQTAWLTSGGEEGWEPGPVAQGLYDLYAAGIGEPDIEKRDKYAWEAVRIWIDEGPFHISVTQGLPWPVFVKKNLRNIPNYGVMGPWVGCPGIQDPPQWFFKTE